MKYTRRNILRTGLMTGAASLVPVGRLRAFPFVTSDPGALSTLASRPDPAVFKAIALRAIDAAKHAGAQYADVRVTRTTTQTFAPQGDNNVSGKVSDHEHLAIGVRVLVNNAWGFAASPYWDTDEADLLAKSAVEQARSNAQNGARVVDLVSASVETGEWVAPAVDPFGVTIEEKLDFMNAWRTAVLDQAPVGVTTKPTATEMAFLCQEQCVATAEGTLVYQRFYTTEGKFGIQYQHNDWQSLVRTKPIPMGAKGLYTQQGGWETLIDARISDQIPVMFEEIRELMKLQGRAVDVGRYDVVFDAESTCKLVGATLGRGTQIDYALGFEANAGGTSAFAPDPATHIGSFRVGAPFLNVSAGRSMPRGCASARWDAEGARTQDFPLVEHGILTDFQTTRDSAGELRSPYDRKGVPTQSRGCSRAGNAIDLPLQSCANLTMRPGANDESFESLVRGVQRGFAVIGASVAVDFQGKSGWGGGDAIMEIIDGKFGKICPTAGFLFNTFELWKSLAAIGGPGSEDTRPIKFNKGQPGQQHVYTVSAVPLAVRQLAIIDRSRRV